MSRYFVSKDHVGINTIFEVEPKFSDYTPSNEESEFLVSNIIYIDNRSIYKYFVIGATIKTRDDKFRSTKEVIRMVFYK